jgi:hypothetical protein
MATVTKCSQLAQPTPQPRLLPAPNSDFYPITEILNDSPKEVVKRVIPSRQTMRRGMRPEYSTPCPVDRFEAWRNRAIVRTIP